MKAYEFQTKVTSDGKIEVPDAFLEEFLRMRMQGVRVIVLINKPTDAHYDYEEQAWARLTAEQFFAGYSDADAIYDNWVL